MDPKNLSLTTDSQELSVYVQCIKRASEDRLSRISNVMQHTIDEPSDPIMISTTGSDGRHENKIFDSNASNTEISILSRAGQCTIHM